MTDSTGLLFAAALWYFGLAWWSVLLRREWRKANPPRP